MKKLCNIIFIATISLSAIQAKMVEFVEDLGGMQAPKEICDLVEQAAANADIDISYEVAVPKKPGLQINPWNNFICSGINPITKNFFITINPAWFLSLPHNQQMFLITRCFMQSKLGIIPTSAKCVAGLFIALRLALMPATYILLGKTPLAEQKIVKGLLTWAFLVALNMTMLDKVQAETLNKMYRAHDIVVGNAAIEKTGKRKAAIRALQVYEYGIKKRIREGDTFFVPYENVFGNLAKQLRS